MQAAYVTIVHYSATYTRKLRRKNLPNAESKKICRSAIMAEEIPHFNLNFDFLYTQANDNDIRNENGQRGEKEKRFPDLTEEQRDQRLVDIETN